MGSRHLLKYEDLVKLPSKEARATFIISICKMLYEGGTVEFETHTFSSSSFDKLINELDKKLNESEPLFDLGRVYDALQDEIGDLSKTRKEIIDNQLNL